AARVSVSAVAISVALSGCSDSSADDRAHADDVTGACASAPAAEGVVHACGFQGPDGTPNCSGHCSCSNECVDDSSHRYKVTWREGSGCQCLYDGKVIGECALQDPASYCVGCCPEPWVNAPGP